MQEACAGSHRRVSGMPREYTIHSLFTHASKHLQPDNTYRRDAGWCVHDTQSHWLTQTWDARHNARCLVACHVQFGISSNSKCRTLINFMTKMRSGSLCLPAFRLLWGQTLPLSGPDSAARPLQQRHLSWMPRGRLNLRLWTTMSDRS